MFRLKSVLTKLILPIFMIVLLLSIAGCGSNSSNPESPTSGSTTQAQTNPQSDQPSTTATDAVTYENYLKIKIDSTYDDVKSILGEGNKKVSTTNADIVTYHWGAQGKTITVRTNKGKVDNKSQTNLGKITSNLTEELFNKITTGMTIDQVVSILGPDYQEVSTLKSADATTKSLVWMMADNKRIKVQLKDDKVSKTYNYLK